VGESRLKVLFLNIPSPPRKNVERDFAGGFGVPGAPSRRRRYGHDLEKSAVLPPLFEGITASLLRKAGHEVALLDAQIRDMDLPSVVRFVSSGGYDLLVARPSLPSFREDVHLLGSVKSSCPDMLIAAWGAFSTTNPQLVLGGPVDLVISGELESVVPMLCEHVSNGQDVSSRPGVMVEKNGKVSSTSPPPIVKDLDSLPYPLYEIFDMERYYDHGKVEMERASPGRRFFTIQSSRGCPFACWYCPYIVEFGPKWRAMSPERTVDELEILVERHSVEAVWFRDPTWNFDPDRSLAICKEIVDRGLDVVWRAEMRADLVDDELAVWMKKAGCVNAQLGLETGDRVILSRWGKRGTDLEKMKRGFQSLSKASVPVTANVLVGLPGETWRSVAETALLLDELRPRRVNVAHIIPYPGTRFYMEAEREGWMLSGDLSRIVGRSPVVSYNGFSARDITLARRYLLDRTRPRQKYRRLLAALSRLSLREAFEELRWILLEPKVSKIVEDEIVATKDSKLDSSSD